MASTRSSSPPSQGCGDGETRLEALALAKVAEAADAIAAAATAGEVVRAIHAVAALLFPVDSAAVAGEAPIPNPPTSPQISHSYHIWCVTPVVCVRSLACRYRRGTLQDPGESL